MTTLFYKVLLKKPTTANINTFNKSLENIHNNLTRLNQEIFIPQTQKLSLKFYPNTKVFYKATLETACNEWSFDFEWGESLISVQLQTHLMMTGQLHRLQIFQRIHEVLQNAATLTLEAHYSKHTKTIYKNPKYKDFRKVSSKLLDEMNRQFINITKLILNESD